MLITSQQSRTVANQRKKGQKLVGAYVSTKAHKAMEDEAKRRGITLAALLRELVDSIVEKAEKNERKNA